MSKLTLTTKILILFLMLVSITVDVSAQDTEPVGTDEIAQSIVHLIVTTAAGQIREGSGVIVSPEGVIFTARHIIEAAAEIRVEMLDRLEQPPVFAYYARILYISELDGLDFGIIQVFADESGDIDTTQLNLPYINAWNEHSVQRERIEIFGYLEAAGGVLHITSGIIGSIQVRPIGGLEGRFPFYQSDTEFGDGASGGPAIDSHNALIGIALDWREFGEGGFVVTILPIGTICEVEPQACIYEPLQNTMTPVPVTTVSPVLTPQVGATAPAVVWQRDCDWERNWQRQAEGSYLWVGLPPGSPGCPRVGQSGTALTNVQSGALFVVDVGSQPQMLAICTGEFTADTVIQGTRCTELRTEMPQVAGRLMVRNSTSDSGGFSVGS